MEKTDRNYPRFWKIISVLVGSPVAFFFYFLAKNEYFLPIEIGRIVISIFVIALLVYRLVSKKALHILFFTTLFLACYNGLMILGGLLFLEWWSLLIAGVLGVVFYFTLRGVPVFIRIGVAFIALCLVAVFALQFEREFDQKRCIKQSMLRDPVFTVLDTTMHPYDFALLENPRRLVATYGLSKKIIAYDPWTAQRPVTTRMETRGVQRLTPVPGGSALFAAAWGHWSDEDVLRTINPITGKILSHYNTRGCRNAFEVVTDVARNRFYLLCEASHNLLLYSIDESSPIRILPLPGADSYDIILDRDGENLYITDWLSPYLVVVDAAGLSVKEKIKIGWSAFGVVEGPDGELFVARPIASEVVSIDGKSRSVIARYPVGFGARDLDVDPARKLLFVGNYFDGTLDVIDITTGKRISRRYAGRLLRGLYYDVVSDRLYLATGCGVLWANGADLAGNDI